MLVPFNKVLEVHKNSIIKNGVTEGFFNVFIFRKISILISWFLASLEINPNFITTISFLLNICAGIFLLTDFNKYKIIAIFLIALGFVLDMSDGEVARLRNKKSEFGAFYDPFLDRIIDIALPCSIAIGSYIKNNDFLILACLILYVSFRSSLFYIEYINLKIGLPESIDSIRKIGVTKYNYITKYIKWDGGFIIVLYSLAIYLEQIIFLFIFLSFFYGIVLIAGFTKISKYFRNEKHN